MNIEIWCKSFLSIYSIIPNIINSIDKFVYLKSVSSSGYTLKTTEDTFTQLNKIASLTQKKVNLINLKLLCDEVLLSMPQAESKLILLRYIDQMPCEKIMQLLNLTRRTYFRKLAKALKSFNLRFCTKILNNKILYKNFCEDNFFDSIFEKINTYEQKLPNNKNINLANYSTSLCNLILKQIKKAF